MSGPVSSALENEILSELRQKGIVVWLDKDASYTPFVDDLIARRAADTFPFPVFGFRGSFLGLLFQLESHGNGLGPQHLLVHMPGFNEESIRKTPLLELYEAGVRFRKGLDTLVREAATGRVAPAEVDRFVATGASLDDADAWLTAAVSVTPGGLAAWLDEVGPVVVPEALVQPGALAARVTSPADVEILTTYLHKLTGMDAAWLASHAADARRDARDEVLAALAAWCLCVEYVHDLRRPPHLAALQRLRDLSTPVAKACCELVAKLRRDNGDAYALIADEVEAFLAQELSQMTPEDLGQIDTFRGEEDRVLRGAIAALRARDWPKGKAWCEARKGERSFWLQRDQRRRMAWMLVAEATELGETIARHPKPFAGARSLEEATERYSAGAFEVDRAHRRFEQKRLALLDSRLPHSGDLLEVATDLRRAHRAWADALARDFAKLCTEHGFLPPAALQQRTLFEQVVVPLLRPGEKVAVFLIDAFRFEMATEIVNELAGAGTIVDLKPRLAELPTITSVGMNVLAPVVEDDRLRVAGELKGFRTGEYTVDGPAQRARAMGMRGTGKLALSLELSDVCAATTADLTKRMKPHQLVVVHSREIDDAGEANVGLPTFESTLRQLTAAWHHLQLAGVKSFVFTADHGFLLQDETTEERPFGTKRSPQRRHVLDAYPRAEAGMVNVSLSSLGYDGLTGYLLFRDDTAVFATGNPGATFVHGGNSPQERIIPVLTISRKQGEQAGLSEYAVEVEAQPPVMGLQRLRLRVGFAKQTTTSLGFVAARDIALSLRVPEREDIRAIVKEVTGPGELKTGRLRVPVGDAWTEVFFGLEGPSDERVRVEAYPSDNLEKVTSASPDQWYAVSGMPMPGTGKTTSTPPPEMPAAWADAIADEGIRRVFLHIEKHGVITELEVAGFLVTRSSMRRFTMEFDQLLEKLPFKVVTEPTEAGKRYVRGDR